VFRSAGLLLAFTIFAGAQASLENVGKPMRIPFECTEADTQASGLSCSEEEPCPVYLELANVEAVGNKLFLPGNLHTPTITIYSILLATEDAGKTWTEPHPRIRSAGFDQIQFIDFQNGWISGANLQSAPRDPFLLLTTDGGKTWRQRPIYEDSRVAIIERFWFDSPQEGTMLVDARLEANRHELYETRAGGESWSLRQASASPIRFPKTREAGSSGWRIRADAATNSYAVEKSEGERWQKAASFQVHVGSCKQ
jgi:photosystem II stability/assembly factor-like uncharacterized protein